MTEIILWLLLFIVVIPLSYLEAYFFVGLPKRYGYCKFLIILFFYVVIIVIGTYLLYLGFLSLLSFIFILILMEGISTYYFRKEIKEDLKITWKKLKGE